MHKDGETKRDHQSSNCSELNLSNIGRGIWIVKVPKYIAHKWNKAPSDMKVGTLTIKKYTCRKADVSLSLSEELLNLDPEEQIPTSHTLDVSVVTKQTLGVFSHFIPINTGNGKEDETEKLSMEGRIVQRLECRPVNNERYMQLKLESIRKACAPLRKVQPIQKIVQNFKPVKDHAHNIEYRERKKAEGRKARDDKQAVLDMLFNAFERHQYYNIKDLVRITNQPIGFLKEVLKDICVYNVKNPHKNTWELKKEYRYYKDTDDKKAPPKDPAVKP